MVAQTPRFLALAWTVLVVYYGRPIEAVQDTAAGLTAGQQQPDDANERLVHLEMQMRRLQADMSSMENILGEILIALQQPDDQMQANNYYHVTEKRTNGNGPMPSEQQQNGMRGKKMVFLGSRGRRDYNPKRQASLTFLGSRGRRANGLPAFFGSRG